MCVDMRGYLSTPFPLFDPNFTSSSHQKKKLRFMFCHFVVIFMHTLRCVKRILFCLLTSCDVMRAYIGCTCAVALVVLKYPFFTTW